MDIKLEIDIEQLALEISQKVVETIKPLLNKSAYENPIFDVESLSAYLGVKKAWIYGKVHHKEIPHYKVGKFPRFKKKEIDKWLDSKRQLPIDSFKPPKIKLVSK